jgi:hypothetical protein
MTPMHEARRVYAMLDESEGNTSATDGQGRARQLAKLGHDAQGRPAGTVIRAVNTVDVDETLKKTENPRVSSTSTLSTLST